MTTEKVQKPRLFKIPTVYTKPCSHSNFTSVYITQKDFLVYRGVHGFWCFPFLVTLHTMIVYFYEILMGVTSRAANLLYKQNKMGKGNLTSRGAKEGARSGRECLPLSLLLCHQFLSVDLSAPVFSAQHLAVCVLVQTPRQTTHSLPSSPPHSLSPNSKLPGKGFDWPVWIRCPLDPISCSLGWGPHSLR